MVYLDPAKLVDWSTAINRGWDSPPAEPEIQASTACQMFGNPPRLEQGNRAAAQVEGGVYPFTGRSPTMAMASRKSRKICRTSLISARRSSRASRENQPVFQRALRDRSKPAGVIGPRLVPPCMRQVRRLRTAGAWHGSPFFRCA